MPDITPILVMTFVTVVASFWAASSSHWFKSAWTMLYSCIIYNLF